MRKNIFAAVIVGLLMANSVLAETDFACFRCVRGVTPNGGGSNIVREVTTCDMGRIFELQNSGFTCTKQS